MIDFDPDKIRARLVDVGLEWADADAAASLLEETKATLKAELKLKSNASSDAAKETDALASPEFKLHLANMVAARKDANRAKVRYETGKMWAELRRSKETTLREEMKLR